MKLNQLLVAGAVSAVTMVGCGVDPSGGRFSGSNKNAQEASKNGASSNAVEDLKGKEIPEVCLPLDKAVPYQFNVLVFGDADANSSDVEGRLGIGGNGRLTDYSVGDVLPKLATDNQLVVAGNLSLVRGSTPNGVVAYGGTLSDDKWVFGFPSVKNSTAFDFINAKKEADALAIYLSALQVNSTVTSASQADGKKSMTIAGAGSSVVARIAAADLAQVGTLTIKGPATATAIINVSGSSASFSAMDVKLEGIQGSKLVFNFYEATSLAITKIGTDGSVLAPKATIDGSAGVVRGYVIAQTFKGSLQVNNVKFNGCYPVVPKQPPVEDNCDPKSASYDGKICGKDWDDGHPGQTPNPHPGQTPGQTPWQGSPKGGSYHHPIPVSCEDIKKSILEYLIQHI